MVMVGGGGSYPYTNVQYKNGCVHYEVRGVFSLSLSRKDTSRRSPLDDDEETFLRLVLPSLRVLCVVSKASRSDDQGSLTVQCIYSLFMGFIIKYCLISFITEIGFQDDVLSPGRREL